MTILAVRHNNPGNVSLPIKGWTGGGRIVGAPGQPAYADFPSMQVGFNAMMWQLKNRIGQGYNTIGKIGGSGIYEYPPTQNWVDNVARVSGIPADQMLVTTNDLQMSALATGIIKQETGMTLAQLGLGPAPTPPAGPGGPPVVAPPPADNLTTLMVALEKRRTEADIALKAAQAAKDQVEKELAALKARIAEAEKEIG